MPKPRTSFDFVNQEPGNYLLSIKSVEWTNNDRGELICRITNEVVDSIEHGSEFNNTRIFDQANQKNDFGVTKVLGLLMVTIGIPDKDYPSNYFFDTANQTKAAQQLTNAKYGALVKHTQGKDKVFVNISSYFTQQDYQELLRSNGASQATPASGPAPASTSAPDTGDGW